MGTSKTRENYPVRLNGATMRRNTKLTPNKVRELRKLRAEGWTYGRLAERYGITLLAARNAAIGRSWCDVE